MSVVMVAGPLMFAACSNDQEAAGVTSTTVATPESAPPSVTSIVQPAPTTMAEPNCESHRPAGFPTVVSAMDATVGDVRAIRVGTLPPQPTDLLLPSYSPDEPAVFCVASDGDHSYSSYWVASGGEVGNVCTVISGEGAEPPTPKFSVCP